MKSYVEVLIFFIFLTITKIQCQVDDETSYFEIGQRLENAHQYAVIGGRTDLRNNNSIELRYVALHNPASFMELHINAKVKTFQFIYLNESACIIRFLGLNSSNPLVTAVVKIQNPEFYYNEDTERYEYDIVNKTMVLQMVKQVKDGSETTTVTNEREYGYPKSKVMTQQTNKLHFSEYNDFHYCDTCGSSTLKISMLSLCCVMIINFTNLF